MMEGAGGPGITCCTSHTPQYKQHRWALSSNRLCQQQVALCVENKDDRLNIMWWWWGGLSGVDTQKRLVITWRKLSSSSSSHLLVSIMTCYRCK